MTIKLFNVLLLVAMAFSITSNLFGQQSRVAAAAGDKYVISAKAGGVNYTEGRVVIARVEGKSGQLLKGDDVQIGDTVATGTDGRAEILLNPGSYMRVDRETEFSFLSTALDDLKLKLNSGSAIFEVIADADFRVSVQSPKGKIDLVRSGVYRIDVAANGEAKISVTRGTAVMGSQKTQVKAGHTATVAGETVAVAKFDRDQRDGLDTWSRDRAKELTKVNSGLQRKVLRDSLLNSFNQRGWNMYDSFGLWIFDPFRTSWCFMPFGYGWGSPYGFGYGYDFWRIGMPEWIYYAPPPIYRPGGQPTGSPPAGPVAGPTRNAPTGAPRRGGDPNVSGRAATPPYRRIESSQAGSGEGVVTRRADFPQTVDTGSAMPSRSGSGVPSAPMNIPTAPVRESTQRSDPSPVRGKPRDN